MRENGSVIADLCGKDGCIQAALFHLVKLALQYALTGHISFVFMIWLGNLLMLGVLWLMWQNFFKTEQRLARRLLLFAPVCYLFFQLNYVENLDWAMCGMQTVPVLLFTLASLHFLLRNGRGTLPLACGCAALACLSSANAFLLGPIGLLVLMPKRRWIAASAWIMSFAIFLYLYRYTPITRSGFNPNLTVIQKMMYFFSFTGAAVENQHHLPARNISVVAGMLIVGVFLYSCRTKFYRVNPFALYSATWFLLSSALVAQLGAGLGSMEAWRCDIRSTATCC